jgi:glycosyltransferase involved in cell wall biosynthesis
MHKIAYLIDTIERPIAGTECQLLYLLRELNRDEFDPTLCVLRSSTWLENTLLSHPVFYLDLPSLFSLRTIKQLKKLVQFLRAQNITIIQSQFTDACKFAALAAMCVPGIVHISTRRSQLYWHGALELSYMRILNKWTDHFIANCQYTKDRVVARERLTPQAVTVIPNGVDLSRFDYDRNLMRQKYRSMLDLPANAIVIAIVANLRPPKSIDVFLRAAKLVRDANPNARFLIVGDGPMRNSMVHLSQELGINTVVTFLGARRDIPEILSAADIGVLSSSSESSSNAILEYMASGLPVVCTDAGGSRESVIHGETGLVVEIGDYRAMADCILRIAKHDLFSVMGQKGQKRIGAYFCGSEMVRNHESLYRSLIGLQRRR